MMNTGFCAPHGGDEPTTLLERLPEAALNNDHRPWASESSVDASDDDRVGAFQSLSAACLRRDCWNQARNTEQGRKS